MPNCTQPVYGGSKQPAYNPEAVYASFVKTQSILDPWDLVSIGDKRDQRPNSQLENGVSYQ